MGDVQEWNQGSAELADVVGEANDRRVVEGNQRAWIDDLAVDTLLLKLGRRIHCPVHHHQVSHDGYVLTFAPDDRFAERNGVVAIGNLPDHRKRFPLFAFASVEQFMFKDQYGVVVTNSGLEQTLRIVGRGRTDDL